jgi:hypothetical protein
MLRNYLRSSETQIFSPDTVSATGATRSLSAWERMDLLGVAGQRLVLLRTREVLGSNLGSQATILIDVL